MEAETAEHNNSLFFEKPERRCEYCNRILGTHKRKDSLVCSPKCRTRKWRAKVSQKYSVTPSLPVEEQIEVLGGRAI